MTSVLRVYVGYDDREQEAYDVACHTLRKHTSVPVAITPLRQDWLRSLKYYTRSEEEPASTQFAHTRFLVPYLANYEGFALFFDCDFMWTKDVAKLFDAAIENGRDHDVWCVQHKYKPKARFKMDGAPQIPYPRKNWSSLMLFDCGSASAKRLTLSAVNVNPASWLHQFRWAEDDRIGALPEEFNWLEGEYDWPDGAPLPAAVHFTNGGPWHKEVRDVRFGSRWRAEQVEAAMTEKKHRGASIL